MKTIKEECPSCELLETKQALLDEMMITNKNLKERNQQLRNKINSYKANCIIPIGIAVICLVVKCSEEK